MNTLLLLCLCSLFSHLSSHFYDEICSHPTTVLKNIDMTSWAGQSCCYSCLIQCIFIWRPRIWMMLLFMWTRILILLILFLFLSPRLLWDFSPFSSCTPAPPTHIYIYMYILCSSCPSAPLCLSGDALQTTGGLQICWRIGDSLSSMFTVIPYCTTGRDFVGFFLGHILSVLIKNSAAREWWGVIRAEGRYLFLFCFFFSLIP